MYANSDILVCWYQFGCCLLDPPDKQIQHPKHEIWFLFVTVFLSSSFPEFTSRAESVGFSYYAQLCMSIRSDDENVANAGGIGKVFVSVFSSFFLSFIFSRRLHAGEPLPSRIIIHPDDIRKGKHQLVVGVSTLAHRGSLAVWLFSSLAIRIDNFIW